MGMFDDIECKYPLPMPNDPKGYTGSNHFQTKDLDNSLSLYEIREDGTIWRKFVTKSEYVEDDKKSKSIMGRIGYLKSLEHEYRQQFDITNIRMYDYMQTEGEYDYNIDYEVNFENGVVKNVKIVNFKATDNKSRKERDAKWKEESRIRNKFTSTLRYRFVYQHWNKMIRFVFRYLHSIVNFIHSNLYKIERYLII